MSSNRNQGPTTTDRVMIEAAPEGGFVIYGESGPEVGYSRRPIAAFSDIEGVNGWLDISADRGGFILE